MIPFHPKGGGDTAKLVKPITFDPIPKVHITVHHLGSHVGHWDVGYFCVVNEEQEIDKGPGSWSLSAPVKSILAEAKLCLQLGVSSEAGPSKTLDSQCWDWWSPFWSFKPWPSLGRMIWFVICVDAALSHFTWMEPQLLPDELGFQSSRRSQK